MIWVILILVALSGVFVWAVWYETGKFKKNRSNIEARLGTLIRY